MDSVKLKIQERAFPSRGRARMHESYLRQLDIKEGDEVEIYRDEAAKPGVVTVFADTMVEEGYIRLSPEDIATIGAAPGTMVNVKKRLPLTDRVRKGAEDTAESVKSGAKEAAESMKVTATKAGESLKGGTAAAKESIEKGTETVKKKLQDKDL